MCIFCIRPGPHVERTRCVNPHPFLQWIPNTLEDELVYNPVVSAKISSRSHKNPVFYCRELGLVTNWFAWDVILTWKKLPLISVGSLFANTETLCIQSLSVPLKVPVKFLIIMNTGPRALTVSHFPVSAQEGKGQVHQQHFDSHQFTAHSRGLFCEGWAAGMQHVPTHSSSLGPEEATQSSDFPSSPFKLLLQNSCVLFEQHKATSVVMHLHQNFLC